MPEPRKTVSRVGAPSNLVACFVGSVNGRGLVDTGASISLVSQSFYRKLLRCKARLKLIDDDVSNVFSADNSPLKVRGKIETDIKIGGIVIPATFLIADQLSYEVIIGSDLLEDCRALIDTRTNMLVLFDGLTAVPMTKTGEQVVVRTLAAVTIPPFSEAIVAVNSKTRPVKGQYIIEGDMKSPCQSLLVARALINTDSPAYPCRVMNPTQRPIKLRSKTPLGVLASVTIQEHDMNNSNANHSVVTMEDKLRAIEAKKISLKNTALKGIDFSNLVDLLYENIDLFASDLSEMPGCKLLKHRIDTGNHPPVRLRSYRQSPEDRAEISRQTEEMIKAGIIVESDTPYSSPVLLVQKKDGSKRFVVDFRVLNSQTALTSWPLPVLDDVFDVISEQKPTLWSSIDLRSGYWQAELDEETAHKTGFQTHEATFCFKRLPMGICGAVPFYQMLMQKVLRGLTPSTVLIYLDDILCFGRDPKDMIRKLGQVFDRLRQAGLRMHPGKCSFGVQRVEFLGHVFDSEGVHVNENKIKIVRDYPVPVTAKQVRAFLGLANYYRRFVLNFSKISEPLRKLLQENVRFVWSEDCQQAFQTLKNALVTAPVLALPDFQRPFILTTDASVQGLAYILSQKDDKGRERVCCYGGRGLRPNEKTWGVSELECLAIVEGCRTYHVYLAGKPFEIVTDHKALTYLNKMKLSGHNRLTRWALFLQGYKYTVTYKQGPLLTSADAISRIPREGVIEENSSELVAVINERSPQRTVIEFDVDEVNRPECVSAVNMEFLPSLAEINIAIKDCPDFKHIFAYLDHGLLPDDDVIARKIVTEANTYVLHDGTLFHMYEPRTKNIDRVYAVISQVCVPVQFRDVIAKQLHDRNCHIGFDRLYSSVRARFYWPGMYAYLRNYVLSCLECQQCKRPIHPNAPPVGALPIATPCTRWNVDFHGRFPESNGKRYILAFVCCTSGWPELIATEDVSAESVVQALYDNIVCRYGLCRSLSLQSDCGSAFISQLMKTYCETFGVKQTFTSPYNPSPNVRVEAFADTIHKSLRVLCKDQGDWSNHLQSVAYAYRASATTNLELSPAEVVFGWLSSTHGEIDG